jgi:hypothetical protein
VQSFDKVKPLRADICLFVTENLKLVHGQKRLENIDSNKDYCYEYISVSHSIFHTSLLLRIALHNFSLAATISISQPYKTKPKIII